MHAKFQTALRVIFPPQCVSCGSMVDSDFQLCGTCWVQTPFITGLVCNMCGVPLPGRADGEAVHCDECIKTPRPWAAGRAALLYKDGARRIVLGLKHGGRLEVARAAGVWLDRAAQDLLRPDMVIAPVPLHWTRLFSRTFNQSAALARAVADRSECTLCPDLLTRPKHTVSLDSRPVNERFDILEDAIQVHPRRRHMLHGRPVLLVDDVMTSGATFSAAAQACRAAGSGDVFVLALARVAKDA